MKTSVPLRLLIGWVCVGLFVGLIFVYPLPLQSSLTGDLEVGLSELADPFDIKIGAAVRHDPLFEDEAYRNLLIEQVNLIIPEHNLKMDALRPSPDEYNFKRADALIDFAEEHNMAVRGHTLVWHIALPRWLRDRNEQDFTDEELHDILEDHIRTVVSRYRGRIAYWDVVNETIRRDTLRETLWLESIGDNYIDLAFQWAHESDPDAHLMFNDFDIRDLLNEKSDAAFTFIKGMVERGVPVHGVGFQMHLDVLEGLDPRQLEANMRRYADIGLEVHITELDIRVGEHPGTQAERLAVQADIYIAVMEACLRVDNCSTYSTWGIADAYNWIERRWGPDEPLLFDDNFRPKPAAFGLANLLTQWLEK